MKFGSTKFVVVAAISAFLMVTGSTAAWAQCPASPSYTPDFSSDPGCVALNYDGTFVPFNGSNVLELTTSAGHQVGSAWYSMPQTVENGFTTSFQFQFTNPTTPPADGIAFVIQNSSTETTGAIGYTGGSGGALAYGDADSSNNPSTGAGIPNSLAIEFDVFRNGWDPASNGNGSDSHVAIQSCGTGPNTSHHNRLCGGTSGSNSTVGAPVVTATNMADGNMHSVTIIYTAACSTCSPATSANIQVMLDEVDVFASPVTVDLSTIGLGAGGTAYVGFTGATGGDWETQDILNWTFAPTQQGQQINPTNPTPASLTQSFTIDNTSGQVWDFGFDYAPANTAGTITIQPGTTPFVSSAVVTPSVWTSITNGTQMADANCLLAAGAGQAECAVNTLACTTTANSTPQGSNCPSSSTRNVLFTQEIDLAQNQPAITVTDGVPYLNVPAGYAPGLAMAPDVIVPGGQCAYPNAPLSLQLCPQNIMTVLEDGTPKGGGTAPLPNSTYVLFCCEPERATTATIALWNNTTSVPVSFNSAPPPTPNPNPNNFQAAQGAFVVVGAELPSLDPVDTTYPVPGEESLNANNGTPIPSCPALGVSPATPWSTQVSASFTVNGVITDYYNGSSTNPMTAPLTEGSYSAHYFSVDCDNFEELVYPASINVTPGPPTANVITFKTVPFNIDLTAPTVTSIALSPSSGPYPLNSSLTASVTCTDPTSSGVFSGIAQCGAAGSPQAFIGNQQTVSTTAITLNTAAAGTQSFTATAVDVAGNTSAPDTISYQVSKGAATVTLSNLMQVYTGSPLTPTATTNPPGLAIIWTGAPDTNPGRYAVTATVNDPNYQGSASGTFTIKEATITPGSYNFGEFSVGQSAPYTFAVQNPGKTSISIEAKITGPTVNDPDDFKITGNTCGQTLAGGATCYITVTFTSDKDDTLPNGNSGYLTILSVGQVLAQAELTAQVINPAISLMPTSYNFESLVTGTSTTAQVATLTNSGPTTLIIKNLTIGGNSAYTLASGDGMCAVGNLAVGDSCWIYVSFAPTSSKQVTAKVTITDNAASHYQTISLSGK